MTGATLSCNYLGLTSVKFGHLATFGTGPRVALFQQICKLHAVMIIKMVPSPAVFTPTQVSSLSTLSSSKFPASLPCVFIFLLIFYHRPLLLYSYGLFSPLEELHHGLGLLPSKPSLVWRWLWPRPCHQNCRDLKHLGKMTVKLHFPAEVLAILIVQGWPRR